MQYFLVSTFLLSQSASQNVASIMNLLKNYKDVGKKMYGRKTSKPPEFKHVQMTILQLIGTGILCKNCSHDRPSVTFALGVKDNITPLNLVEDAWKGIKLIS